MDAARPKHRFVALDSLRGVCACMVVLYHFGPKGHVGNTILAQHSALFVDFFFVLSGFVIGWSYGKRLTEGFPVGRFMWLRLGRVYPLHLFMLLLYLAFEIAFALHMLPGTAAREPFQGVYSILGLVASLFAVQIFIGPEAAWNAPSWSIAAEIWTYLIFGLLLRFASRWILPLCVAIMVAALVIIPTLTDHYLNVTYNGALLRCMYGFALGIVGWKVMPWVERWSLGGAAVNSLIEAAIVVGVALYVIVAGPGPLSMIAPLVFFIAVMVFARERGLVSRLLRTPPFVLIGTLSYSIYMIHWFMLWRFLNAVQMLQRHNLLEPLWRGTGLVTNDDLQRRLLVEDALALAFITSVVIAAYLTYRLVERPGQRFSRNRLSARPAPAQQPAPVAP